ncbi:hypothetical protein AB7C87_12890 [Natrarchaeobius sp. A-rgal3]|uniref:DUF7260 family protein n=1 Tax=Natrarchaeobius versutus TaxID=1679078 RepID=UPI00350EB316
MSSATPTTTVLEEARKTARRERRVLADEKRAFERFHRRLDELEASQPQIAGRQPLQCGTRASGLQTVRNAYTETVMDSPHYGDEYDETPLESMAEELGPELAVAVAQHTSLHAQLKRSLLEAAEQAIESRERILDAIDTESTAIGEIEREVEDVADELNAVRAQPIDRLEFNALRLTRERLDELRSRCDELAAKRQRQIRRRRGLTIAEIGTFERYLYDERSSPHPVLGSIAELGDRIERTRSQVDRRLAIVR